MKTKDAIPDVCVNIHEAKTNFSRLVERAMRGESVVIAKAGMPVVKLVPVDTPDPSKRRRLGFLAGTYRVPDAATFNSLGRDEIAAMFAGDE